MIPRHLRFWFVLFLMTVTLPLPGSHGQSRRRTGELVELLVLGGTIVTMDQGRRVIEDGGIAVRDGRIVAVGSRVEIEAK